MLARRRLVALARTALLVAVATGCGDDGGGTSPRAQVVTGAAAEVEAPTSTTTTTTSTSTTTSTTAPVAVTSTTATTATTEAARRPVATTTTAPSPPRPAERVAPPPDAGIAGAPADEDGVPVVHPDASYEIWTLGCEAGVGRFTIRRGGDGNGDGLPDDVLQQGDFDRRDDDHPGERARYAGTLQPLRSPGDARAYLQVECGGAATLTWFELTVSA